MEGEWGRKGARWGGAMQGTLGGVRVSELWMFYAVPTARVIFTAKTSLDVFSLRRQQVWTFSV